MLSTLQSISTGVKNTAENCPDIDCNSDDLREFFKTNIVPKLKDSAKNGHIEMNYPLLTYSYVESNPIVSLALVSQRGFHRMPSAICGQPRIHEFSKGACEYGKAFRYTEEPWPKSVTSWFVERLGWEDNNIYKCGNSFSDEVRTLYNLSKAAKIQAMLDAVLFNWKEFDSSLHADIRVSFLPYLLQSSHFLG
jgi:hypothetical protein